MAEYPELLIFGEKIKSIRKQRNLSQEDLAALSGLHRTYIGGIERGERNVALLNIVRIAQALNVQASELMQGLEDLSK